MSTCRNICANGWRRGPRPRAISSSRSTSTRRVFCEVCYSGARRGREPGIHRAAVQVVSWIPGSRPGMTGETKKACRHLRRQAFVAADKCRDRYATQRLLKYGASDALSGDDLSGDVADAGACQSDGAGRALGEVEHASLDEGAAVIDGNDDALAAMGHTELGSERQRAVGCGHGV